MADANFFNTIKSRHAYLSATPTFSSDVSKLVQRISNLASIYRQCQSRVNDLDAQIVTQYQAAFAAATPGYSTAHFNLEKALSDFELKSRRLTWLKQEIAKVPGGPSGLIAERDALKLIKEARGL